MMTSGSLFTGILGFDLAFKRAGMKCLWHCEIDKHAQSVIKRQSPGVTLYDDVRSINKNNTKPVDLICGGFPCQDVSVAGKRAGLAGGRSGLWFEFHRIIDELRPQWVVIENVPGLLSSNGGQDFAVILRGLGELGYLSAWRILDSQYFGVAQRRRRVFIVASIGNGRAAEVLFEREGMFGNPPTREKEGERPAYSVNVGAGSRNNPTDTTFAIAGIAEYKDGIGTLRSNGGDIGGGSEILVAFNPRNSASRSMPVEDIVSTLESANTITSEEGLRSPRGDGSDNLIAWEMQHASEAYRESGEIVPTLQSRMGTGGNQVPMIGVRRLTPTECERLQGFPDGWTAGQSDSARYKQLGNAVTVNVVEWIGRRIMEINNA